MESWKYAPDWRSFISRRETCPWQSNPTNTNIKANPNTGKWDKASHKEKHSHLIFSTSISLRSAEPKPAVYLICYADGCKIFATEKWRVSTWHYLQLPPSGKLSMSHIEDNSRDSTCKHLESDPGTWSLIPYALNVQPPPKERQERNASEYK